MSKYTNAKNRNKRSKWISDGNLYFSLIFLWGFEDVLSSWNIQ